MKLIKWSNEKNELLKKDRNISFEVILEAIANEMIIDITENPNYPGQKILIIEIDNYIYSVPFVETENEIFLKTIIPSRKLTKKYLGGINEI